MEVQISEHPSDISHQDYYAAYAPDWLDTYMVKLNSRVLKQLDLIFENSTQIQQQSPNRTRLVIQQVQIDNNTDQHLENDQNLSSSMFEKEIIKVEQEENKNSVHNQLNLQLQQTSKICHFIEQNVNNQQNLNTECETEPCNNSHNVNNQILAEDQCSLQENIEKKQENSNEVEHMEEFQPLTESKQNFLNEDEDNCKIQGQDDDDSMENSQEEEESLETNMEKIGYYDDQQQEKNCNEDQDDTNKEEEKVDENEQNLQFDYIFHHNHQQNEKLLQEEDEGQEFNFSEEEVDEEETEKDENNINEKNERDEDCLEADEMIEKVSQEKEAERNNIEQEEYEVREDFENDEKFDKQNNNNNEDEEEDFNKENQFNQQNSQNSSKIDFTQTQNLAAYFGQELKSNIQQDTDITKKISTSKFDLGSNKTALGQQIYQQIERFSEVIQETDQYLDNLLENLLAEKKKLLIEKSLNNQKEENINNNEIVSLSCNVRLASQENQNQENIDPQQKEGDEISSTHTSNVLGKSKENSPSKKTTINVNNNQYHAINMKATKQMLQNKSLRGSQKQIQNLLKIIQGYDKKQSPTNNNSETQSDTVEQTSENQQQQQASQQHEEKETATQQSSTTSSRSRLQEFYDQKQKENLQAQQQKQYLQQQLQQQQQQQQQQQKLNSIPLNQKNINKLYRLPKLYQNKEIDITNFVDVSKDSIKYGIVLPGYIIEEDYEVFNKSNENLVLKVVVLCSNEEFDDYDEYIYSIRKINVFDYNEKFFILLPPQSSMKFKIALKVPNLKSETFLKGSATVSLQGFEDSMLQIPISSLVQIPNLVCPKELYVPNARCQVINLAVKNGKKSDCKIPLKNNSGFPINLEFEVLNPFEEQDENSDISVQQKQCEIVAYPATATLQSNGIMILNLIIKQSQSFEKQTYIKRILLAKYKNSSLITSFPLQFEIY